MAKTPDLAALAAYIVHTIPESVKNPLYRDAKFCESIKFKPVFAYPLSKTLSVQTPSLLAAIRAAVDGKKAFLLKAGKEKNAKAKLTLQVDGSVSLNFGDQIINIKDADVMAAGRAKRRAAVDRVLDSRPLSQASEAYWSAIAAKRAFSDDEYVQLMTDVGLTPEGRSDELAKPQTLKIDDLVPKERAYYERLIAPWRQQKSIADFIATDLADERRWLLKSHRKNGLRRIAYSALLSMLVPFDLLAAVKQRELVSLLDANDPFSLLFGFELARAAALRDPKFVDIGTRFLQKLFAEDGKAIAHCTVFCAVAVATIARLRLVFEEGSVPLFWFRLAALSHAGVLTQALSAPEKPDDFLKWASEQIGPEYVWHTIVDRRDAPRWEPDWISPEQLYCELVGRCLNAVHLSPESKRPAAWNDLLMGKLKQFTNHAASPFIPGPLDDFVDAPARDRNQVFLDVEQRLKTATDIDSTKGLTGLLYLDRPSPGVADDLIRIIETSREALLAGTEKETAFLGTCARVAVTVRSVPLANAVIDESVRLIRFGSPPSELWGDLLRAGLLACAAVPNGDKHRAMIGETATKFAYALSLNKQANVQLVTIFDALGRRDPKLISTLGRASAINEASALRASA